MPEVSFKCKVCGRLEASSEAGESTEPGFCRVCGSKGWLKLWTLSESELAELALDPEFEVVEHVQPEPEPVEEPEE